MLVKVEELRFLILKALQKKYTPEDSQLMLEVIMFGQTSGITSHGIVRLFGSDSSVFSMKPLARPEAVRKTNVSYLIKGNGNPGMLVGAMACNLLIDTADKNGFAIVGTKESFSTSGCLSYYLEKIAKHDLISIIIAQSPPSTPPYGGIEPRFGTNPISFGIPTDSKPLIFDMATSAITFGDIVKAKTLGKKLPVNVTLDKEGNPTTDPAKAIEGVTLPFGNSYKSAGLAMMVEILSGIWPEAGFGGLNSESGWGNTFMAFLPDLLSDKKEFRKKVSQFVEYVRTTRTKDGSKIRIMGEETIKRRDETLKKGEIEIEMVLLQKLKEAVLKL